MSLLSFRRKSLLGLIVTLLVFNVQAEMITVAGVGSLSPLVGVLAKTFEKENPGVSIQVMHPPLGSNGGLRAMSAGKVDIVLSGRPLKPNESGHAMPWVMTPLVFASQGGKSVKGFDLAAVADVYSARRTQWDDGKPIRLIMRGAQETELITLRALSKEIDAAIGLALKRDDLPVAENDLDAVAMLRRINGSLGTTTLGLLRLDETNTLKTIAVNGHLPSLQAMQKGDYTLVRKYYLVSSESPTALHSRFISYLTSPAAMKLAAKYAYAPFAVDEAASK